MKGFLFYVLLVVFLYSASSSVITQCIHDDKLPVPFNGSQECFASLRIGAILPGQCIDLVDCQCVMHDRNEKLNFLNVK